MDIIETVRANRADINALSTRVLALEAQLTNTERQSTEGSATSRESSGAGRSALQRPACGTACDPRASDTTTDGALDNAGAASSSVGQSQRDESSNLSSAAPAPSAAIGDEEPWVPNLSEIESAVRVGCVPNGHVVESEAWRWFLRRLPHINSAVLEALFRDHGRRVRELLAPKPVSVDRVAAAIYSDEINARSWLEQTQPVRNGYIRKARLAIKECGLTPLEEAK